MNVNENLLIKKSKNGNIDAFEELISLHKKRVYNIALKMLKNPEDAMDASQDALLKIYRFLDKFNEKSSFSTWVYRITVNSCIDYMKKNYKDISYIDDDQNNNIKTTLTDKTDTPEIALEKKFNSNVIHEAINELSPILKTAIVLRDIQGFSYEEISKITQTPLATVKTRIKRAREGLKKILENKS